MTLQETIYKRKSIRKYLNKDLPINLINQIQECIKSIKPLYENIKVKFEIVDKSQIKSIFPWITQKVIVAYSEDKDGNYENIGFIMQQLDLYLQSIGLGTCWLGLGTLNDKLNIENKENFKFIIMMTIGYPNEELRNDVSDFKRKSLDKISDILDNRLEPARLAPSSINNQPWYFVHDENIIHTYCAYRNIFTRRSLEKLLRIDTGIALAHIYISNPNTFNFFKVDKINEIKGYNYVGSFTI